MNVKIWSWIAIRSPMAATVPLLPIPTSSNFWFLLIVISKCWENKYHMKLVAISSHDLFNMFYHYFSVSDCLFSFTMGWDHLENFPDFRWISTHCRRNNPAWNWKIMIEHVTGGHMSLLWPILCVICSLSTLILRSAEIRSWERSGLGGVGQWVP